MSAQTTTDYWEAATQAEKKRWVRQGYYDQQGQQLKKPHYIYYYKNGRPKTQWQHFSITDNTPRPTEQHIEHIKKEHEKGTIVLAAFQVEEGKEEKRKHLQAFIKTSRKISERQARQLWGFNERKYECFGAPSRNITAAENYCLKEATRVEGPWIIGEDTGQGHRSDIDSIRAAVKDGMMWPDLLDEFDVSKILAWTREYYMTHSIHAKPPTEDRPEPINYLVLGPARSGKGRFAQKLAESLAAKTEEKIFYYSTNDHYWDHYRGEGIIVFKEWDYSSMLRTTWTSMTSEDWVAFPQKYKVPIYCRGKYFIFVTLEDNTPDKWWPGDENRDVNELTERIKKKYYCNYIPKEYRQAKRKVPDHTDLLDRVWEADKRARWWDNPENLRRP